LQAAASILAIVPDLDFFFVWVLRMGPAWHRGFAHSIAFSLAVGLLVAVWLGGEIRRVFPVLCAAMASHPLLDVLTSRIAPGPELLWPFYSKRYSAGLVDYLDFSIRVRGPLESIILIVKISVAEAFIFTPLFLVIRLITNNLRTGNPQEVEVQPQEMR